VKLPTGTSLMIIGAILGVALFVSWLRPDSPGGAGAGST
jgi:hypothetical protein